MKWFRTKADKNRFKSRLTTARAGVIQIYLADECLLDCLSALGMNADVDTARDHLQEAGWTRDNAREAFKKGIRQLHALQ